MDKVINPGSPGWNSNPSQVAFTTPLTVCHHPITHCKQLTNTVSAIFFKMHKPQNSPLEMIQNSAPNRKKKNKTLSYRRNASIHRMNSLIILIINMKIKSASVWLKMCAFLCNMSAKL